MQSNGGGGCTIDKDGSETSPKDARRLNISIQKAPQDVSETTTIRC